MSVQIMNLRNSKPTENFDFIVDRRTVLGNKFILNAEEQRDSVCDKYHTWFWQCAHTQDFFTYLADITEAYRKYGHVRLFCWCVPKRCHAETIKEYLTRLEQEKTT